MRATDYAKITHKKSSRFIKKNKHWYFKTREGEVKGPYETEEDAFDDVEFYIALMALHECGRKGRSL
ncbi:DUF6316 family protein [Pleionea sediminis]|uniref:DUF6316 family protein n=1 Tax=Pleionea sediminis TaxID=2569479 RepID=UPI001185C240|nr:DUF6316 family protein [Pleionea sediminis]